MTIQIKKRKKTSLKHTKNKESYKVQETEVSMINKNHKGNYPYKSFFCLISSLNPSIGKIINLILDRIERTVRNLPNVKLNGRILLQLLTSSRR